MSTNACQHLRDFLVGRSYELVRQLSCRQRRALYTVSVESESRVGLQILSLGFSSRIRESEKTVTLRLFGGIGFQYKYVVSGIRCIVGCVRRELSHPRHFLLSIPSKLVKICAKNLRICWALSVKSGADD